MSILKEKLTSRKLWVSIAGFISMLVVAFGGLAEGAVQVSAIIYGRGSNNRLCNRPGVY
jgi:hypothetical protein